MSRGSRLRILLGACIIAGIGIFVGAAWLIITALVLVVASCFRLRESTPTNYTAKYGPPERDAEDEESEEVKTPFNTDVSEDDPAT